MFVLTILRWTFRVLAVLLLCAVVAVVVMRERALAQWRAAVVLADVLDMKRLQPVLETVTDEARRNEILSDGVAVSRWRPGGDGPWPAVIFVTGIDERGRHHPDVVRAAAALARAGYVVYAPDLPELRGERFGSTTVASLVAVATSLRTRSEVEGRKVSLVSVSAGASLALLAAADPKLRRHVRSVTAIAPFATAKNVAMLATTGRYRDRDGIMLPYESSPRLRRIIALSVLGALETEGSAERFVALLRQRVLERPDAQALAPFQQWQTLPLRLNPDARAVLELLANRDPERFDQLWDALPASVHDELDSLSPLQQATGVKAHVELLTAPNDSYFPPEESKWLATRLDDAKVTVTPLLGHAQPSADGRSLWEIADFDLAVVRALDAADG